MKSSARSAELFMSDTARCSQCGADRWYALRVAEDSSVGIVWKAEDAHS